MVDERASQPDERVPFVEPDAETKAKLEAENGLRQFDRLVEMVDAGISGKRFRLRPSQLMELNRIAVENLIEEPGAFRQGGIRISNSDHEPPPAHQVAELLDEMCEYVNDSWDTKSALHLASYVMWRLNWIHPFGDGNGRTSRAGSYLVLCVRTGCWLPGKPTIPERIAQDKFPYYGALDAADAAWKGGELDISKMDALLEGHLAAQLLGVVKSAAGES